MEEDSASQSSQIEDEGGDGLAHSELLTSKSSKARKFWTPEEDNLLTKYYDELDARWEEIAAKIPFRNAIECRKRFSKLKRIKIRYYWTPEEDQELVRLHDRHGDKWKLIAKEMEGRSILQIRERYIYHLAPNIKRSPFTAEEDQTILYCVEQYGPRWSQIALILEGRPAYTIKNRYKSYISKYLRMDKTSNEIVTEKGTEKLNIESERIREIMTYKRTGDSGLESSMMGASSVAGFHDDYESEANEGAALRSSHQLQASNNTGGNGSEQVLQSQSQAQHSGSQAQPSETQTQQGHSEPQRHHQLESELLLPQPKAPAPRNRRPPVEKYNADSESTSLINGESELQPEGESTTHLAQSIQRSSEIIRQQEQRMLQLSLNSLEVSSNVQNAPNSGYEVVPQYLGTSTITPTSLNAAASAEAAQMMQLMPVYNVCYMPGMEPGARVLEVVPNEQPLGASSQIIMQEEGSVSGTSQMLQMSAQRQLLPHELHASSQQQPLLQEQHELEEQLEHEHEHEHELQEEPQEPQEHEEPQQQQREEEEENESFEQAHENEPEQNEEENEQQVHLVNPQQEELESPPNSPSIQQYLQPMHQSVSPLSSLQAVSLPSLLQQSAFLAPQIPQIMYQPIYYAQPQHLAQSIDLGVPLLQSSVTALPTLGSMFASNMSAQENYLRERLQAQMEQQQFEFNEQEQFMMQHHHQQQHNEEQEELNSQNNQSVMYSHQLINSQEHVRSAVLQSENENEQSSVHTQPSSFAPTSQRRAEQHGHLLNDSVLPPARKAPKPMTSSSVVGSLSVAANSENVSQLLFNLPQADNGQSQILVHDAVNAQGEQAHQLLDKEKN